MRRGWTAQLQRLQDRYDCFRIERLLVGSTGERSSGDLTATSFRCAADTVSSATVFHGPSLADSVLGPPNACRRRECADEDALDNEPVSP